MPQHCAIYVNSENALVVQLSIVVTIHVEK